MKLRWLFSAALTGAVCLGLAWSVEPPTVISTADGGQTLSLTVYNVGRALVRDSRPVVLPSGVVKLEYRDIAAKVMPQTVAFMADDTMVLEQNYEYDLLSPKTLLAKFLGREVTLVREEPRLDGPGTVRQEILATLLSMENGTVWRVGDRIVANPAYRELVFDSVPPYLREKPTLVWLLQSQKAGPRTVQATYLTEGITWRADYVLSLDQQGEKGALTGWVTLSNNSGASYPEARLQLVAGEVHVVREERPREAVMAEKMMAKAPGMAEEALGEYHLYTLERPTTILDRQDKQVSLLQASGVKAVKHFVVAGFPYYFWSRQDLHREPVRVKLEMANTAANGLGLPLPAGTVRVYQRDSRGAEQFMGEDRIEHTPKDETVKLEIGTAFDVVAERVQTDFRSFDKVTESAFEVRLRNHKDEPITVEVEENIGGDWEILTHSHPYQKRSAFVVAFSVPVPAHGQSTLAYRVRVRH
ncbi:MAG: DUF4139 domain-containing protein [Thermoanaerobaculum sp.]|nr:MAG: DUF4139 domain-containing protein [Thermoanaerobaculum sp.]